MREMSDYHSLNQRISPMSDVRVNKSRSTISWINKCNNSDKPNVRRRRLCVHDCQPEKLKAIISIIKLKHRRFPTDTMVCKWRLSRIGDLFVRFVFFNDSSSWRSVIIINIMRPFLTSTRRLHLSICRACSAIASCVCHSKIHFMMILIPIPATFAINISTQYAFYMKWINQLD